jgi:hypothetical protein
MIEKNKENYKLLFKPVTQVITPEGHSLEKS